MMAASDPADALQVGLYALLSGDAALTALASIYDGVPEGEDPAWVIIGEMTATPDGVHGLEGRQTSVTTHSWARANSFWTVNDIGACIVGLLWHRHADLDAEVTGHTVWRVDHEFSQTLMDPEPDLRHRVDRFRVWTTQT